MIAVTIHKQWLNTLTTTSYWLTKLLLYLDHNVCNIIDDQIYHPLLSFCYDHCHCNTRCPSSCHCHHSLIHYRPPHLRNAVFNRRPPWFPVLQWWATREGGWRDLLRPPTRSRWRSKCLSPLENTSRWSPDSSLVPLSLPSTRCHLKYIFVDGEIRNRP